MRQEMPSVKKEHHPLIRKMGILARIVRVTLKTAYEVLLNHRYRLQDQTQVLEDYHQALEEDARMGQDYVHMVREHLQVMENLSPDSTQQGGSHASAQVHAQ